MIYFFNNIFGFLFLIALFDMYKNQPMHHIVHMAIVPMIKYLAYQNDIFSPHKDFIE